ncbi:DUF2156 domain-containing protein [Clostridium sp. KNHs214]|uniref:DUF2156 domain-containing protein n=1 Tax=Clostridium sp. KNHs214 TaxID=1540257 RepID=UPI0005552929|nr:DUF2156 domain-containing protein [Clostridium sp. KNHs214]
MLEFKPLNIDDKDIFYKYLKSYKFATSEYSFASLIIWRKGCDIQYVEFNDALIIKKRDFNGKYHFMQPIGYTKENLKYIIEELKKYREKNSMPYLFKDVENLFIEDLKEIYGEKAHICEDIDNFDYIYDSEKLITLSGKKLHSKKNHYNFFVKNYNYEVKDFLESNVKQDCVRASEIWHHQKDAQNGENIYIDYELEGIKEILTHMEGLNLKGMAVYVDGKVAAFTIGERVNDEMAIIHIEKGIADIRGIYAFINKTFAEKYLNDVKYINREQDLGIEGLRKAKKSYSPLKLEEKYCVNI